MYLYFYYCKQTLAKPYIVRRWQNTRVLLIDEVSMLSSVLLEILDTIAKRARKCSSLPMGGLQVILCGDFFQLPPVGAKTTINTTAASTATESSSSPTKLFCFHSPVWEALVEGRCFELTEVYRQKEDQAYVNVLNSIRWGRFDEEVAGVLNQCVGRVLDCTDGILPTQIFTHRLVFPRNTTLLPISFHLSVSNDRSKIPT